MLIIKQIAHATLVTIFICVAWGLLTGSMEEKTATSNISESQKTDLSPTLTQSTIIKKEFKSPNACSVKGHNCS